MATTSLDERTTTLGPDEAARRLGVTVETLGNWRWSGRGPRHVKVGRKVRYLLSDLADYFEKQTRTSTSDTAPVCSRSRAKG